MAQNLYITAMEAQSGKSIVSLGVLEALAGRVERLGFFRPIVPSGDQPDAQIELVHRRYGLPCTRAEMYGLTSDEAVALIARQRSDTLVERVFDAYKRLERSCDVVLCEGTDFAGVSPALDFDLNAELANQLGCPVLVVIRGSSLPAIASSVRIAREALQRRGCELFAVVVNRVAESDIGQLRRQSVFLDVAAPTYVLAENPDLGQPTVAEVATALGAEVLHGSDSKLQRGVRDVRVAAMRVEHFLEDLVDGTLVIVPADRTDILLASIASALLVEAGAVAGVVLTGGHAPHPTVTSLLAHAPFPVLATTAQIYAAATAVHGIRPMLRADDERKIATALGVVDAGVGAAEIRDRLALPRSTRRTPLMFQHELIERARAARRRVVLPEGEEDRVLRALDVLIRRDVVDVTLLGEPAAVRARAGALGVELGATEVIDPLTAPQRAEYAHAYWLARRHRGVTEEAAFDAIADPTYFGTSMVAAGAADGLVSGAVHTTADTIRPAFEIIRAREGVSVVSSVFFMCLASEVLVYGDCAVNPTPTTEQLADIAISSARTAANFGIEPRIAMLSYSTGRSARGEAVDTVARATDLVRAARPDLDVAGPIQYDAAVDADVARLKMPGDPVAGRATVLIFPDLEAGNVAYKAVQRSAGAVAVGPVLQGLRRPVNDLSRGCTVTDIINTVAITAVQAQEAPPP